MEDRKKDETIEIPFSENPKSNPNACENDDDTSSYRPENPPSKPDTDDEK